MTRHYTIVNTSELRNLDYNELKTTSAQLTRQNLAGDEAIVYWERVTPSALSGKTKYTNVQIKTIVDNIDNGWYEEE